jgi:hypothetical protein
MPWKVKEPMDMLPMCMLHHSFFKTRKAGWGYVIPPTECLQYQNV